MESVPSEYKECTLCPRKCHADRTKNHGFCGVSSGLRIARASLHPWEEPCLCGDKGSGTVFFSGCGLRCLYCQNHDIALGNQGRVISDSRLCDIFLELQAAGAANINLVTATQFLPSVLLALDMAKKKGLTLPVVYNSGGYETVDTLRRLEGYVDIYLPDFKYASKVLAKALSNASDYPETALAAISEMLRQTGDPVFSENGVMQRGVIIRHLVLPSHTEDSLAVLREFYERFGDHVYISIMNQYTPCIHSEEYPELNRRLTTYEYEKVKRYALSIGIKNGFFQCGETAKESFIPPFDETGV